MFTRAIRHCYYVCGTIDGAHKGFNPLEPDQSSVNGIPVRDYMYPDGGLVAATWSSYTWSMFVVRVTDTSPNGPCLASGTTNISSHIDGLTPATRKVLQVLNLSGSSKACC
jgi:hypothetical protein